MLLPIVLLLPILLPMLLQFFDAASIIFDAAAPLSLCSLLLLLYLFVFFSKSLSICSSLRKEKKPLKPILAARCFHKARIFLQSASLVPPNRRILSNGSREGTSEI
ncbi:hypothetical protein U1Q18_007653 [Sarracenia purpurea var. burkii]